jgi:hypothetical protein
MERKQAFLGRLLPPDSGTRRRLFTALWDNSEAQDAAAARKVLDGRYAFLEEGILSHDDDRPWVAS